MSSAEVEPTDDKASSDRAGALLEKKADELPTTVKQREVKEKPEDVAKGQRVVPHSEFEQKKKKTRDDPSRKVREGQYEV